MVEHKENENFDDSQYEAAIDEWDGLLVRIRTTATRLISNT